MTRSIGYRKTIMVWMLLLALSIAGMNTARAAESASDDPIRIIPAETLFCVRIHDLNATLSQMDQFLTGISPMGLSMPVRGKLGQLLGGPEPKGIDMSGDFAVFGPLPGGDTPNPTRIGVLVPVSDYQQFVQGNPNVGPPNAQGISAIGPEGEATFAAVKVGNYALLTSMANQQALAEVKTWLSGAGMTPLARRLSPEEFKRATESPMWAYANIQTVAKMFGPMIQQKLQETRKKMQEMQAQSKNQVMTAEADAAIDMQMAMLDSLMQETQFVSLSLSPSPTVLRTSFLVAAMPETDMAKILSAGGSRQQQPNLLGYLRNGAIINAVARLSPEFERAIALKRVDLLTTMLGQTASKEDIAQIRKLALDGVDVYAGDMAWSMSADLKAKPPLEMRYVATLTDKKAFDNLLDQVSKMVNDRTMADLVEKFGLRIQASFKRNAETYKDVPIDAINITMQPVDANSPQAQMMTSFLGGQMDLRLAVVNNLLLYVFSPDATATIHALIDQAKGGGPQQAPSEVQAAMQLIPDAEKSDFFGTYNYLRVLQMVTAMMPMPMPQVDMPSQSNIAFAGDIGESKLLVRAAIPKQHVLEIMTVFMKMQQQQMQERQRQQQQGQM